MNWLYYLLEANLYLILFYALYYLVLRRETWHQYNRAYLLGSSVLAFIIPVLQLGFLKPIPVNELPPQLITHYSYVTPVQVIPEKQPEWTRDDIFLAIYLAIVLCLLISLIIRIGSLLLLSRKGTARDFGKWKIVNTDMEPGAFSFFNYLFVSADMASSDAVIAHELVHIRQKHSWDVIYLEIFRIINWFNPFAYLLQRSVKELHEFIADEAVTGSKEQINTYTDFLVANAYGAYEHQLTNNLFNQSLLKKRIMMLHQKRSGNAARLKYLLVLPLLGGLLCASTLAFAKDYGWIDIAPKRTAPNNFTKRTTSQAGDTGQKINKVIRQQTDSIVRGNTEEIINGKTNKIIHKQTGTIVNGKTNGVINKQMDSAVRQTDTKIKGEIKSQIDEQVQKTTNKLPPASWAKPEFSAFSQHLGRYTRYPAKEWEQKTVGNVVIRITLNSDHKIADVELAANSVPDFDNEVVRAAKLYTDTINYAPGTYIVALQFFLSNEKQTKFLTPSNIYSKFQGNPKFVSLVEVAGFYKE